MTDYYTGVGNRHTPIEICELMTKIARVLSFKRYTLRSGAAKGPDQAFELGAGERKEIYLPWQGFNDSKSELYEIPDGAFSIASRIHLAWDACKDHVKKFHARNVLQVLGKDLNTPSDFVICYTINGKKYGGTGLTIRIAEVYDIPVFNLFNLEHKTRILKMLESK